MNVQPEIVIKQVEECKPGELVRFINWADCDLGIIAKDAAGKHNVFIGLSGETSPYYWWMEREPDAVLSYGHDYYFELQHRRNFDLTRSVLWQANGAIFRWPQMWTMLVFPSGGTGRRAPLHFDLAAGKLVEEPRTIEVAIFGSWRICLTSESAEEMRPPAFVTHDIEQGGR